MIGRPGFPGRVGYGVEFRRFGPEASRPRSNLDYFFKGVWNVPVGILCQHGQSFALDSDAVEGDTVMCGLLLEPRSRPNLSHVMMFT